MFLLLSLIVTAAADPPPCFPITWTNAPSDHELGFTQSTGAHNVWTDRDKAWSNGRIGMELRAHLVAATLHTLRQSPGCHP